MFVSKEKLNEVFRRVTKKHNQLLKFLNFVECGKCKGTGQLSRKKWGSPIKDEYDYYFEVRDCEECDGAGLIDMNKRPKCEHCKGKGWAEEAEEE